jgi:hypothetical protein
MDDDFAQSREPDDLFSDEIEPSETEAANDSITYRPSSDNNPESTPSLTQPDLPSPPPNRGSHRGGRRGAPNGHSSRTQSETVTQKALGPWQQDVPKSTTPQSKPTGGDESRVTSVRGDRSATGPAKPAKKTEAELTELMKVMQLKNAAKTEAYARAEQDQASFLQREKQAAMKMLEERKAIREQDMERAKNRERKIRAQGGREWDSDKQESDIVDRGRGSSSRYSRGVHGGIANSGRGGSGLAESRYAGDNGVEEAPHGGRGIRAGRGRGRADHQGRRGDVSRGGRGARARGTSLNNPNATAPKSTLKESDFPALPGATEKGTASIEPNGEGGKPAPSSGAEGYDWAEQMATPIQPIQHEW